MTHDRLTQNETLKQLKNVNQSLRAENERLRKKIKQLTLSMNPSTKFPR